MDDNCPDSVYYLFMPSLNPEAHFCWVNLDFFFNRSAQQQNIKSSRHTTDDNYNRAITVTV